MGPQQQVPAQVKGVLGVDGRVVLGEIEGGEIVALGLHLGADGPGEAHLVEDLADLARHLGDEVEAAGPGRAARHGEIGRSARAGGARQGTLPRRERRLELALQLVGRRSHGPAGLGVELRHLGEDLGQRAGLAPEDLGLQILEPALVRLRNLGETLPQRTQGC
ncbi:MAG: hypothetical protein AUH78_13970 [Gemmatimonadetes bacterium 13_1_40CM_4_69_8]|nr:MAG: hypothetical protein AUH78_13970 [Gemmatimonadetes bacterium 13_1_40CM_4_69_8]